MKNVCISLLSVLSGLFILSNIISCNSKKQDEKEKDSITVMLKQKSNPAEGGACRVTQGANTGQTGTYTQASDGTWWCKTNGGQTETECTGGRCEDARVITTPININWDGANISVLLRQNSNPSEGGACRVTEGANKGQTGTYTKADDGTWWCKTNGGRTETECTGGRCEDAKVIVNPGKQFDISIVSGVFYFDENKEAKQCINIINKSTGEIVQTICFPLQITKISDLLRSNNSIEKSIAKNIITLGNGFK